MSPLQQNLIWYVALGIVSYLIGAIPFGLLIARFKGIDIRKVGSGNIGATNVFRAIGKGWGILTFACDALKGYLPVILLPVLAGLFAHDISRPGVKICCAVMAVAGHNWPVYLRFKGGKGVATSTGALLALAPMAVGVGFMAWTIIFIATRYVSIASIAAAAAVASAGWFLVEWPIAFLLSILSVVIILRHKSNIQRLRAGTENRFEFKKSTSADKVN